MIKSNDIVQSSMLNSEFKAPIKQNSSNSFFKNLEKNNFTKKDYLIFSSTFLLIFTGSFLVYNFQNEFEKVHLERMETIWGQILIIVSLSLLAFQVAFMLFIIYAHWKYKVIASVSDEELPTCTVIVRA